MHYYKKFIVRGWDMALFAENDDTHIICPTDDIHDSKSCYFSHKVCQNCDFINVTHRECQCESKDWSKNLKSPDLRLPLEVSVGKLYNRYDDVFIESRLTPHAIFITANTSLHFKNMLNSCTVRHTSISGFYGATCANLHYVCDTNFGNANAAINCPNHTFNIFCDTSGLVKSIPLCYNEPDINMICSVHCPEKITYFTLVGNL
jgi:hypothetical protein